jgi:hypothetical protein
MKRSNRILFAVAATAAAVIGLGGLPASADQGVVIGSGQATANLNFRVMIPAVTRLRIGDPVQTTLVDFDLNNVNAPVPGDGQNVTAANGGSTNFPATGTTAVSVQLLTTAGSFSVDQTPIAANNNGLVGLVAAAPIPWTEIRINDSGSGFTHSQSTGTLTGGTTTIFTGGPGSFNGTWTFAYDNEIAYAADTYTGTMQYTVTTP